MFAKLIFGPALIVAGILLMRYTVAITDTVGKIEFAERWFKPPLAGTYTWWRLCGLAIIVVSLLWMLGYLSFFQIPGNPTV